MHGYSHMNYFYIFFFVIFMMSILYIICQLTRLKKIVKIQNWNAKIILEEASAFGIPILDLRDFFARALSFSLDEIHLLTLDILKNSSLRREVQNN